MVVEGVGFSQEWKVPSKNGDELGCGSGRCQAPKMLDNID